MPDENRIHLGRLSPGDVALLKNIADEAAERTVRRFSTAIGIDPDDPLRTQKNMQWVDRTRERYEGYHGKVALTAIGIAVASAMTTAWARVSSMLGGPPPGVH